MGCLQGEQGAEVSRAGGGVGAERGVFAQLVGVAPHPRDSGTYRGARHCWGGRAAVRAALSGAKRVVVLEKSLAVGLGGIVSNNVSAAYHGSADDVYTVVAGLGGRSITRTSLTRVFDAAVSGTLEHLTFLDLDTSLVERVLAREREQRHTGPIAEGILRDLGVVAAKIG